MLCTFRYLNLSQWFTHFAVDDIWVASSFGRLGGIELLWTFLSVFGWAEALTPLEGVLRRESLSHMGTFSFRRYCCTVFQTGPIYTSTIRVWVLVASHPAITWYCQCFHCQHRISTWWTWLLLRYTEPRTRHFLGKQSFAFSELETVITWEMWRKPSPRDCTAQGPSKRSPDVSLPKIDHWAASIFFWGGGKYLLSLHLCVCVCVYA